MKPGPLHLPSLRETPWLVPLGVAALLFLSPAGHAAESGADISWFELAMGLFGGLSFFLYGMERMGEALKAVAGDRMRDILGALSNNRFMGLVTGTFVTAIIQSSSVTTVMLVGFVSAGLMTLPQIIGVILGADIGTTVTAQIVSLKVTKYALLLVSVGFVTLFVSRKESRKQVGYVIMGLGLIFFGMSVMGDAMRPLRTFPPFIDQCCLAVIHVATIATFRISHHCWMTYPSLDGAESSSKELSAPAEAKRRAVAAAERSGFLFWL